MAVLRASRRGAFAATAAVLVAGLFWSCRLPPFDLGLSLAQKTAERMDQAAWIGPLAQYEFEDRRFLFLPDEDRFDTGFVAGIGDTEVRVGYYDGAVLRGGQQIYSGYSSLRALRWRLSSLGTPGNRSLFVAGFENRGYMTGRWRLLHYNTSFPGVEVIDGGDDISDAIGTPLGLAPPEDLDVLSVQVYPDGVPDRDFVHVLLYYRPVGVVIEQSGVVGTPSSNIGPAPPLLVFPGGPAPAPLPQRSPVEGLPGFASAVRYFRSPVTGLSYVSLWTGRRWQVWSWDSSLQAERLSIPFRIEAVLTTGELFCRSETAAYVYSADGDQRYSFPLGDLEFVGERYDASGTSATMVFVLPVISESGEGPREVEFGVYTIATAELESLE